MYKNNTKLKWYIVVSWLTPELTLIINFSGVCGMQMTLLLKSLLILGAPVWHAAG